MKLVLMYMLCIANSALHDLPDAESLIQTKAGRYNWDCSDIEDVRTCKVIDQGIGSFKIEDVCVEACKTFDDSKVGDKYWDKFELDMMTGECKYFLNCRFKMDP